ncbi:Asparagine synthetase [Nitrospira sp. KM1]|nr:Asparagine synthetase [Nitrospira sp. KM1]
MVASLRTRGPDDSGVWEDRAVGTALGHARLSILDLSPEGHQPMLSAGGRFVIVFNGEIFNFSELRSELEVSGETFRGHSDTEVMLAAFERWGIEKAVQRFVGMFAFALWDRESRVLHLVRDRVGIKPLYYGWAGGVFCFGSELKALRQVGGFESRVNRSALLSFIRTGYVPAPLSIFENIYKLPGGCMLTVTPDLARSRVSFNPDPDCRRTVPHPVRYWSAREVAESGVLNPFEGSDEDAIARLEDLLRQSVRLRMISDVPLGAFLSGGIDSSIVVALMQAQHDTPVKTFTIGFHEQEYNEAAHAKSVARHLGTDHTELYVTPEQAMAVIPRIPDMYDEPFGDSSQIPTYLVSQLARSRVTVALSGDGGDELFGGYSRYFVGRQLWKNVHWLPQLARQTAVRSIRALSPDTWSALFSRLKKVLPAIPNPGDKLHKLAEVLALEDPDSMYLRLVSQWDNPSQAVVDTPEPLTMLTDRNRWARLDDFTLRMMFLDLMTYLPDDILTKVDRASMAVSLEARVPLLDHRLLEFAWRLPLSFKIRREGEGKWLLRQVLYRYVPQTLIDRPKMGFGVPIDHWLRGPLREWAEDLLAESRLRREGFLCPEPIRMRWLDHLSGARNWQYPLWNVLMFQAWLEAYGSTPSPAVSHH